MKKRFILLYIVIFPVFCLAQIEHPVTWSFSSKNTKDQVVELQFVAIIEDGWHVYSQFIQEGGPVATSFKFITTSDYQLIGNVKESVKPIKNYEKVFDMEIAYFAKKAIFIQKVKLNKPTAIIKGTLKFMACNDEQCLPPDELEFNFNVKNSVSNLVSTKTVNTKLKDEENPSLGNLKSGADTLHTKINSVTPRKSNSTIATITKSVETSGRSLWAIFLAGLLGGFAAFIMPCIFPMLPFTVSYFTKTSNRKSAVGKALFYGLSIILIYVFVGLIVTISFGADALNSLSTNGIFNFLFFILLVVFGTSFLGAFEITLPSSWVNKADAKADSKGFLGIFFMAATLALVSFSCTGPIIGTLLVQAATMGQYLGPAIGMFGFALALAIPFALFAMFPTWLNSMPKSGGWLNSVKVVLGFLELALALKFLSNVDLAYHWNWFDREIYLVLWIVIFGLMGLYLLGKFKLAHDSDLKKISVTRLILAILVLSFTMYMIPGLWGAPLRSIAAFLPPQQTQDFDLYTVSLNNDNNSVHQARKYKDIFQAPFNLDAFFDYEEGLAYAKKANKPVMIDFTGHACVNCRKMEADVWSNREVLKRLSKDYVLIQLYVDDKTQLAIEDQYLSEFSGKSIKTIGNKWCDVQASRFNSNSQPFYVLLDTKGNPLTQPKGADYNSKNFVTFIDNGLKIFSER